MLSHTAAQLVHLLHSSHLSETVASDTRTTAGVTMAVTLAAVGGGVFVALRVIAVVAAVIRSLVQVALTVGTTVLVVGFFASIFGLTYLGRSMGF
jgi:hypothetical protein